MSPSEPPTPTAEFYHVQTPEVSLTFIGQCRPDPNDNRRVLLCSPGGDPLLSVERRFVRKSSQAETAERLREDARARAGRLN